jgi:two-component system cell cycle response regulator CpdR
MKILVAEDEPSIAESYKLLLGSCGHDVMVTFDGEECLRMFQKHITDPFDLVILDYRMPKKDGVQVAMKIRSDFPNQKIILATAYANDITIADLKKQEFTRSIEVIQKPFELDYFLNIVKGNELCRTETGIQKIHRTNEASPSLLSSVKVDEMDPTNTPSNDSSWTQGLVMQW